MTRYFFDLPVYRVTEVRYRSELTSYAENTVFPKGTPHGDIFHRDKAENAAAYQERLSSLQGSFGGCWRFNEIIGYIRLHFLGTQVRGEYYAPNRRRLTRTRTRTLVWRSWKLAPEVEIDRPITGTTIPAAVRRYIEDCRRELPKRHIDTELFDTLFPYLDWLSLYRGGA